MPGIRKLLDGQRQVMRRKPAHGERVLALEMAVEGALRHAGRRDDLLDAGCVIALAMNAARPASSNF
jgi:hypothetical protein